MQLRSALQLELASRSPPSQEVTLFLIIKNLTHEIFPAPHNGFILTANIAAIGKVAGLGGIG
jgi:hypothetical protein